MHACVKDTRPEVVIAMTDGKNKTPESRSPVKRLKQSPLDVIAADLREEAKRRGFTREELATAIKSRRSEPPHATE